MFDSGEIKSEEILHILSKFGSGLKFFHVFVFSNFGKCLEERKFSN